MKTRRLLYFSVAIFLGALSYIGLHNNKQNKSARLIITFGSNNLPSTEIEIQKSLYPLEINLGSKFPLTLSREMLAQLEKKEHEPVICRVLNGDQEKSPAYILPEVKIGDITFTDVLVKESDIPNMNGCLGRPLLEKFNLLLDFPNSTILLVTNFDNLQKSGYYLDGLTRIPFEEGRTGIILQTEMDIGNAKMGFSTGSTVSVIRASLLENKECDNDNHGLLKLTSSKLVMGDKNFGSQNLYPYDITTQLSELDGFLGMDFLKKHIIYIDFQNHVVYIGERH